MTARAAASLAGLVVIAYAAVVVHDFYLYVDRAIYLAYDDTVANSAYALARTGHYGFPASPTLVGLSRSDGLFNYGPWYFYLGAGLIRVFGYSLTLLRAIHLWTIVGSIVAARWWFHRRERGSEWAIFAVGVLWFFEAAQWPMARPDAMVSVFAITFIVTAGLAIASRRPAWWFAAGIAAGCGALTHLVAWSLVPAAALVWMLSTVFADAQPADARRWPIGLIALAGGGLVAGFMFYASFGFRFREQLAFLRTYQTLVAASLQQHSGEVGYVSVLHRHFSSAYGLLPSVLRWAVALVLAAGWATLALAVRSESADRRLVFELVLPPVAAWSCYLVSLGSYANLHSGYAILNQVLAPWTATAVMAIWIRRASPTARTRSHAAIAVALTLIVVVLVRPSVKAGSYRMGPATRWWVRTSQYVDQVLAPVLPSATAWGSLVFGIEHPDRIQLIDYANAVELTSRSNVEQIASLAPEFIVWGYTENRNVPGEFIAGAPMWPSVLARRFPAAAYRLVSLVEAAPYGTTRVYVLQRPDAPAAVDPVVSAYDPVDRRWLESVGRRVTAALRPAEPMNIQSLRIEEPRSAIAASTRSVSIPPGHYVVHVSFTTGGDADSPRLIVAASTVSVDLAAIETMPPRFDLAVYSPKDSTTWLVVDHEGGPLYIGQFDTTGGAALDDIDVRSIQPASSKPWPDRPYDSHPDRSYSRRLMDVARRSGVVPRL